VDRDPIGPAVEADRHTLDRDTSKFAEIEPFGDLVASAAHQHIATGFDVLGSAVHDGHSVTAWIRRLDDHERVPTLQLDARPVAGDRANGRPPGAQLRSNG
jgi:hypothetical protein